MRTTTEEITVYVACNGARFKDESECEQYEKEYKENKQLRELRKATEKLMIDPLRYLIPMCVGSNEECIYTYFEIKTRKEMELINQAYCKDFDETDFPFIAVAESSMDLRNCHFDEWKTERKLLWWQKLADIKEQTVRYWKKLGYRLIFEQTTEEKKDK